MKLHHIFLLCGSALASDLRIIRETESKSFSVADVSESTARFNPRQSTQWPRPASGYITRTDDWACLSKTFTVYSKVALTGLDKDVMSQAADDLRSALDGSNQDVDCLVEKKGGKAVAKLIDTVSVQIEKGGVALGAGVDESYELELKKGETEIGVSARNVWGARHALTTLRNLLEIRNFVPESAAFTAAQIAAADNSHHHIIPYSSFAVADKPRLGHRGVMIDVSRSYQPISTIQRTLQTMAKAKLNLLHIHATDDQSFPLLIGKSSTKIHGDKCPETGPLPGGLCAAAYTNQHIYTKTQMQDLITLGAKLGIRVIIEIDQPAHARSWAAVDPTLRECDDMDHQTPDYCAEPICGPLALSKNWDAVVALAHMVTDDWLALQTDTYMHYGMDEVKPGCWGEEKTEELSMEYLKDALAYLHDKDKTRRMVVWQDGIAPVKHSVPKEVIDYKVIAQVWNDPTVAESLIAQGTDVIWSSSDAMYLDCGRGNPAVANYTSWCSPYKTWWTIYKETPDISLQAFTRGDNAGQVLGGEVALWAEQANAEVFDSLLWPRAAAWAGAAWEARTEVLGDPMADEEINNLYKSEYELRKFTNMIINEGVAATSTFTEWCVFEDKAMCDHYSLIYLGPDGPEVTTTTTTTPEKCSAASRLLGMLMASLTTVAIFC